MVVSPTNIIDGLFLILKANVTSLNKVIRIYDKKASLHLFKGIRKTLPLDAFPSLEMEPVSGGMDWITTSAQSGEYVIDCVLTVNVGQEIEKGVDYISNLTRKITKIFNYPQNMSWEIPNEWLDKECTIPILCQYSDIRSVDYLSSKDFSIRVARFQIVCKTTEPFPEPGNLLGPARVEWKRDEIS